MDTHPEEKRREQEEEQRRESGLPGGGAGRREEPGHTGVYPVSSMDQASGEATAHGQLSWGQGERGAAGYEDSGDSEVMYMPPGPGEPGEGKGGVEGEHDKQD